MPPSGAREGGIFKGARVFLYGEILIKEGILEKNVYKEGIIGEFSVKKIFFIRKIPRVESFRGFTHHASVPFTGGGTNKITSNKEIIDGYKFVFPY
jgi:hypothetical protein